jgi:hypothetical protein
MPDKEASQNPSGDTGNQPSPPSPPIPTIEERVMALEAQARAHTEQNDAGELASAVKTGECWLIGINGSLLVATIVIACIYSRQLTEMRTSNAINRESLESVQRAFVTFHYLQAKARPGDNQATRTFLFQAVCENVGVTPAIDAVTKASGDVLSLDSDPSEEQFIGDKSAPVHADIGAKSETAIGPVARQEVVVPIRTADVVSAPRFTVENGKSLYIWGWIAYRDIFPTSRPHVSEWCQELYSIGVSRASEGGVAGYTYDWSWRNCRQHNCGDEKCPDYSKITSIANLDKQ